MTPSSCHHLQRRARRGDLALALAIAGLPCSRGAVAQTPTSWLVPVDGSWTSPAAWSNGVPPLVGNVQFGVAAAGSPFVVTIDVPMSVGTMSVVNQSPTLAFPDPSSLWLVVAGLSVAGSTAPTLTLDGGLASVLEVAPVTIGSLGGRTTWPGHLRLTGGASLMPSHLRVHAGSLMVDAGSLVGFSPIASSLWIGDGGSASLCLRGTIQFASGTLVGVNGGSATVVLEPGSSMKLGDAGMALGGELGYWSIDFPAEPGVADMIVEGASISGGATLRVGRHGEAKLRLKNGAAVTTPMRIGTGIGGGPSLEVESAATIGSLAVSSGPVIGHAMIGPGALLDAGVVTVGYDSSPESGGITPAGLTPGMITLADGATLSCASLTIEEYGKLDFSQAAIEVEGELILESDCLTIAGERAHLGCETLTMNATHPDMAFVVDDHATFQAARVRFGDDAPFDWHIDRHAQCVLTDLCDLRTPVEAPPWPPVSAVVGTLTVARGGTLSALTLLQGREVTLRWVLDGSGDGTPMTVDSADLDGRLEVLLDEGAVPPTGERLPLLDVGLGGLDFAPRDITATSINGVPLVVVNDDLGLAAYALDEPPTLSPIAPSNLHVGDVFTMPVTLTAPVAHGVLVTDVARQCTWTFEPLGSVAVLGPIEFAALTEGRVIATAHFGPVTASVAIEIGEAVPPLSPFVLLSGTGVGSATVFGNGDSGGEYIPPLWGDEDLGPGPRSASRLGQEVAFGTLAGNLSLEGGLGADVVVRSTTGGFLEFVSYGVGEVLPGGRYPAMSSDGRYVVYRAGPSASGQVVVRDRFTQTSEIALRHLDGTPVVTARRTAISDDGRYVLCEATSDLIVPGDSNGKRDVFLVDRALGSVERVSQPVGGGQLAVDSSLGDLSGDGRWAIFLRSSGGHTLAYRYDRDSGTVTLATPAADGSVPQNTIGDVSLSGDGRWLAFTSTGPSPMTASSGGEPAPVWAQAYCRDLVDGVTYGLSRNASGAWASAAIEGCVLSRDAKAVVLTTKATNLTPGVPGLGNGLSRVVVGHLGTGLWTDHTVGLLGPLNGAVLSQLAISDAVVGFGTTIAFTTGATNVIPNDSAGYVDAFAAFSPAPDLGDLNGDGDIGPVDLAILLGSWGGHADAPWLHDLDGDQTVGASDVAILLGRWPS